MPARGEFFTEKKLEFVDVRPLVGVHEFPFAVKSGVQRNLAPVCEGPPELHGEVIMPEVPVIVRDPVLVEVQLKTVRQADLHFLLKEMLGGAITLETAAPPLFETRFPRCLLQINTRGGEATVGGPLRLAIGPDGLFLQDCAGDDDGRQLHGLIGLSL
jgi:hypothetical protein